MWNMKKKPIPHQWMNFDPEVIYDEYDGPILFTARDHSGEKYLVYFCDRADGAQRFLVVPISDQTELKMASGDIDLREALLRSRMWLFDLDYEWNPVKCWQVRLAELPRNLIPRPGVMLRPSMQSFTKQFLSQSNTSEKIITWRFEEIESNELIEVS